MIDGQIVAAIAEERLTRQKHAGGFVNSAARVRELGGVKESEVDEVAISFYQHPYDPGRRSMERIERELGRGFRGGAFIVGSHHLSHAASAFYQSPFERALVCVWDNEGSIIGSWAPDHLRRSERHSYYYGEGNKLKLINQELDGPDDVGFGQGYARFTRFVGFGNYTNAGKLMGLAAYGDPLRYALLGPLWTADDTGRLKSMLRVRDRQMSIPLLFARQGIAPPPPGDHNGHHRQEMRDLAAYVQHRLEQAALSRVAKLLKKTGAPAVCIAGGVGLNSVLNAKLQRDLGVPVYVPPHPDDTGQALGNVILAYMASECGRTQSVQRWQMTNDLGGHYTCDDIDRLMEKANCSGRAAPPGNVVEDAAEAIAHGAVVGWFQGGSEYGARALGQRSILADPRSAKMKETINKIKGREYFRPVAPAVAEEAASEYFELDPSPLWSTMSGTATVRPNAAELIQAAVHVDGTARPQLVNACTRPLLHALLTAFARRTGIPVLLNTSFNSAGEPIVETPKQACRSASSMGIDVLYIGGTRVDFS